MALIEKVVIVTPNVGGDVLTARETSDSHSTQWLPKLQRGKVYKAVEDYVGFYRLLPIDPFPFTVPAGKNVWADKDFLPDYVPEPDPEPGPAPAPVGDLEAAVGAGLAAFCEAFLQAYWGE